MTNIIILFNTYIRYTIVYIIYKYIVYNHNYNDYSRYCYSSEMNDKEDNTHRSYTQRFIGTGTPV